MTAAFVFALWTITGLGFVRHVTVEEAGPYPTLASCEAARAGAVELPEWAFDHWHEAKPCVRRDKME